MKPHVGRPKSDNPKSIEVKVRIDKATNDKLLAYCEEHNILRAEAIRLGIEMVIGQKK